MNQSANPILTEFNIDDGSFVTGSLASRVADKLLLKIRNDALAPSTRLPSEHAMAQHFNVSRTVMREAIGFLKADGILISRKGSGIYVAQPGGLGSAKEDRLTDLAVQSLLNLIEVRRGVEAETTALAAIRRTPGQLAEIEHAMRKIEDAVAAGFDGAEEDMRFHLCIAEATGNTYWVKLVEMFSQPARSAAKVTRANEARRIDFGSQVREEHEKITSAIALGDPELARTAAWEHMAKLAERVRLADREFWHSAEGNFARNMVNEPSANC